MFWVLKRTVSMRRSFEHPKHMFRLLGKKIITNSPSKFCLTGPMQYDTETVDLFFKVLVRTEKSAQAIG